MGNGDDFLSRDEMDLEARIDNREKIVKASWYGQPAGNRELARREILIEDRARELAESGAAGDTKAIYYRAEQELLEAGAIKPYTRPDSHPNLTLMAAENLIRETAGLPPVTTSGVPVRDLPAERRSAIADGLVAEGKLAPYLNGYRRL